jgi:hypothetical protein
MNNKELREAAKAKGENKYMPNEACRNGHLSLRYTNRGHCIACVQTIIRNGRSVGKYITDKDKRHVYNKEVKYKKYGLTKEEFDKLILEQNNKCKICHREFEAHLSDRQVRHIDHCHKTGKVRGILCNPCNRGLGCFKDNIKFLHSAIDYLEND